MTLNCHVHGLHRAASVAAALALALLGATGATPAQAAANPVTHPRLDWAGSQFAKLLVSPNVSGLPGLDVSGYQGDVNWSAVAADGAQFAYVKATESTTYTNPYFSQQYEGSYDAGIIRGAYHFATPDTSSGAAQADYFVANGGGWSGDGKTLPGMLNPYGADCYGLSQSAMVDWILSFSDQYQSLTGRWPVIYTATSWWSECTGDLGDFSSTNPLALADYNGSPGTMPYAWSYQTIWQYADSGTFPGDQDAFNGSYSRLQSLATG
jgi:GH25 family lysozyme M1 (1,4-beta-N-acetylmuramidase)